MVYNPMTVCARLLSGLFLAPFIPRCHLMALASAACVLCHFLIWDFSDAAARTRGKLLVDTGSCRPRCASTLIHRATCPRGEDWTGVGCVYDKCSGAHSAQLLWGSSWIEPRMYYGVNALIFCFILCSLPLLFLGLLSQNKTFDKCLVSGLFSLENLG